MSVLSQVLGVTHSACPECGELVPARVVSDGKGVYLARFCTTHGEHQALVHSDLDGYLHSQRYLKPAWQPIAPQTDGAAGCPESCGFCPSHEQHLCMPIIEITTRCNLACPICINSSGDVPAWDMSIEEFRAVLEGIFRGERQVDVLNLSGGEPLLHPGLLDIIDEALGRRDIVRVSVSTNGLCLLDNPDLVTGLRDRKVVISLQLDGLGEGPYPILRGRPLLQQKLEILDLLREADITTSLVMTAAAGLSEPLFRDMLGLLFEREHIVSLMIQPLAYTGRAAAIKSPFPRLTTPDIVRLIGEAGYPGVHPQDFVPLPCSHPLCFSLAFYLMLEDGGIVSVASLTDAGTLMDSLANRIFYGLEADEQSRLRDMIFRLWSGPAGLVPDRKSVLATLRSLLRQLSSCRPDCFDARHVFTLFERHLKSIFIHAFQDAETFDLARVRRCCQAYPQPDGSLIPACVRNVLRAPALSLAAREGFDEPCT